MAVVLRQLWALWSNAPAAKQGLKVRCDRRRAPPRPVACSGRTQCWGRGPYDRLELYTGKRAIEYGTRERALYVKSILTVPPVPPTVGVATVTSEAVL